MDVECYYDIAQRDKHIAESNNKSNPNQNVCMQAVAHHLCPDLPSYLYLHVFEDLHDLMRLLSGNGIIRYSFVYLRRCDPHIQYSNVGDYIEPVKRGGYIISIPRHIFMIDDQMNTLVDTAPDSRVGADVCSIIKVELLNP